jgi:hypothetical protein
MFTMADAKDGREAAWLFKLAADQGDASAQVGLGNLAQTQMDNVYAADKPRSLVHDRNCGADGLDGSSRASGPLVNRRSDELHQQLPPDGVLSATSINLSIHQTTRTGVGTISK